MRLNRLLLTTAAAAFLFTSCNNDDDGEAILPGTVSVSAPDDSYQESADSIAISFGASSAFDSDVTVTYEVSGTATADTDYKSLSGIVILTAGETTVTQNLELLDDDEVERSEDLVLKILSVDGGEARVGVNDQLTLTITDNDSFAFENGILILNEGNFGAGNTSVTFLSDDFNEVEKGIYSTVNEVDAWGDTAQSMAFNGDLAYIVVNGSQKVEVVNRYTFETIATIGGSDKPDFLNPRYMAIANGKGYVTNWGDGTNPDDDFVAVVNLESNTIENKIPVAEGPERLLVKENTLYVALLGGYNFNNSVAVIDATANTVTSLISVADGPNSLQLDAEGNLWVLSGGKPAYTDSETAGQLHKIDTESNMVIETFTLASTEHPGYLSYDANTLYYNLGGSIFKMDVSSTALPEDAAITGTSFYDMTVNQGKLYGTDAKDFASNGALQIYDLSDNSLIISKEVGINPGAIYFNDTAER